MCLKPISRLSSLTCRRPCHRVIKENTQGSKHICVSSPGLEGGSRMVHGDRYRRVYMSNLFRHEQLEQKKKKKEAYQKLETHLRLELHLFT